LPIAKYLGGNTSKKIGHILTRRKISCPS
jgi:hypothetical protein